MSLLISIHAPRERSDILLLQLLRGCSHFNPRSSWEERHILRSFDSQPIIISIHAPRERSDSSIDKFFWNFIKFQSTLLVRGATKQKIQAFQTILFQSTLLVRGATYIFSPGRGRWIYFNPRSSWEERLIGNIYDNPKLLFQSTLLVRGATH